MYIYVTINLLLLKLIHQISQIHQYLGSKTLRSYMVYLFFDLKKHKAQIWSLSYHLSLGSGNADIQSRHPSNNSARDRSPSKAYLSTVRVGLGKRDPCSHFHGQFSCVPGCFWIF